MTESVVEIMALSELVTPGLIANMVLVGLSASLLITVPVFLVGVAYHITKIWK